MQHVPFPRPIIPRVFPLISTPTNLLLSHFPFFRLEQPSGIFLAIDSINAIVCSAAAPTFPDGEFITTIPSFVAAVTSTGKQEGCQSYALKPNDIGSFALEIP